MLFMVQLWVSQKDGGEALEWNQREAPDRAALEAMIGSELAAKAVQVPDDADRVPYKFDVLAGTFTADVPAAETKALAQLDREMFATIPIERLNRALCEEMLWREIQRLKLTTDAQFGAGQPYGTDAERRRQFPVIWELAKQTNTALAGWRALAATAEAEIQPAMIEIAMFSALGLLGRRNVKAAITAKGKLDAADAVDWSKPPSV